MLSATGLSKFYESRPAISNVSFHIEKGEIVGLLGLNGAGKSTILKILGCFLLPTSGEAKVHGYSVESNPYQVRELIGFLPDRPPLYNEMTVRSYLHYVSRLKNIQNNQVAAATDEVSELCNLTDVADVRISELSHGFCQRVGIAQALVHKPKVLILDEPINGLDPVQIVEMRDLIISLKGKHTVILSSHILSEMTKTCDRILIVDQGRIVAEGSEEELQGRVTQSARITCEVANLKADTLSALKKLPHVTSVDELKTESEVSTISLDIESDIRAEISREIVNSGSGLLSLKKEEDGLEKVFMKLVQSSKEQN